MVAGVVSVANKEVAALTTGSRRPVLDGEAAGSLSDGAGVVPDGESVVTAGAADTELDTLGSVV